MCFRIPVVYGVSLVQPELIFGEVRDESCNYSQEFHVIMYNSCIIL